MTITLTPPPPRGLFSSPLPPAPLAATLPPRPLATAPGDLRGLQSEGRLRTEVAIKLPQQNCIPGRQARGGGVLQQPSEARMRAETRYVQSGKYRQD